MALIALIALVVTFPLFAFGGTTDESRTEPMTAPSGQVSKKPGRATLNLKSMQPVVVSGRGFGSGESVRVSGIGTKRVRASTAGAFTVNLGRGADRCNGFTLVAVGSNGSRASLNFSQLLCVAP